MRIDLYSCPARVESARCGGELAANGTEQLRCAKCGSLYAIIDGIPALRPASVEELRGDLHYMSRNRAQELKEGWYEEHRTFLVGKVREFGMTGPTVEIGCGNGLLAPALPDYIGLEYSMSALTNVGWGTEERVCANAEQLPFKTASIGLVVSVNAIEHVGDIGSVFAEMDRVLRPGGMMFLWPAWHCTRANTELLSYKKYGQLNARQRAEKFLLPVARSRVYKFFRRIPGRLVRRACTSGPTTLKWGRLTPSTEAYDEHGKYLLPVFVPDTDARADIDIHESIMYFVRRGYECISHPKLLQQFLAQHEWVILRKPLESKN